MTLLLRLVRVCDGDQATIGAVLDVTRSGVAQRLRGKRARPAWLELKAETGTKFGKEKRSRWWWRRRLQRIGIDPHTIPMSDPLWHACFRLPKGELARQVIVEMRDDLRARGAPNPDSLASDERVTEFCERVEQRKREHFAPLYGNTNDATATRDARMLALLAEIRTTSATKATVPRAPRTRRKRDIDKP